MTAEASSNPAANIPADLFSNQRVVIIGGGVAGIAAAVRLAEYHVPVTLIETRTKLGGRATSFIDPTTKDPLDNCQHVLMGCCTNLIDLYKRLGVYDRIEWHHKLYFANTQSESKPFDIMKADPLPAPLHLTRAMLGFKTLTLREKFAISRAMSAIIRTSFTKRNNLDSLSFLDWLKQHKQPESAIKKYWEVIIVSACNESLDRCSSRYALQVIQEGFLHNKNAWVMGLSTVPLLDLYDPAESLIQRAGGSLTLSQGAQSLNFNPQSNLIESLSLTKSDEPVIADAFISSVPFDRLDKLSTPELTAADTRLQNLNKFTVSPIIGIHVYIQNDNTPVMHQPHLILTDSPIQWIFNKGNEHGYQHLHCVISAAHDLVDKPASELNEIIESELRRVLPNMPGATIDHIRPVKEKRATFSVYTGLDQYRPIAAPSADQTQNLFFAGDWVDTGWPATMEGATRSGYNAAHAAINYLLQNSTNTEAKNLINQLPKSFLIPDLPTSTLYKLASHLPF